MHVCAHEHLHDVPVYTELTCNVFPVVNRVISRRSVGASVQVEGSFIVENRLQENLPGTNKIIVLPINNNCYPDLEYNIYVHICVYYGRINCCAVVSLRYVSTLNW